ncbi:hypothetical protein BP5796_11931 [Coleophoma crateriformis]|uniref:Acyltransferase 3 domain-containing protein n=1 Tax=Coleophoma crateriformis TaxID=565419 RepID=A0A3D8QBC4_9HELO|nr:hypothetical protein BP5796_11931 [Coleophoma crateriformis]
MSYSPIMEEQTPFLRHSSEDSSSSSSSSSQPSRSSLGKDGIRLSDITAKHNEDNPLQVITQIAQSFSYSDLDEEYQGPLSPTLKIPQSSSYSDLDEENQGPLSQILDKSKRSITTIMRSTGRGLLIVLVTSIPSFLRPSEPKKLYATSYLDGLRGFAAFFVYIFHFIPLWYPDVLRGFGSTPTDYYIIQLPIIRVFYAGPSMVSTFFVISGYVLSYRSLQQIRNADFLAVLGTLSSSMLRRGLRLFLPTIPVTFVSMLLVRAELYGPNIVRYPERTHTFWEQFHHWYRSILAMTNPFQSIDGFAVHFPAYNGHLWTIPLEFRGSAIIFLTVLAFAKLRSIVRIPLMVFIVYYSLWLARRWDLFLFLSGILLADLNILRSNLCITWKEIDIFSQARNGVSAKPIMKIIGRHKNKFLHFISISLAIIALYLLSTPVIKPAQAIGFATIVASTPVSYSLDSVAVLRFWGSIGAVLLVIALSLSPAPNPRLYPDGTIRFPLLQRPFVTPLGQYLGNISFSLYIVHFLVFCLFGLKRLTEAGEMEKSKYTMYFCYAFIANTALAIWVADLVWRLVDVQSVRFSRWLEKKCIVRD